MSQLLLHDSFEPYYAGREKTERTTPTTVTLQRRRLVALRMRALEKRMSDDREETSEDRDTA